MNDQREDLETPDDDGPDYSREVVVTNGCTYSTYSTDSPTIRRVLVKLKELEV